jgi:poly-D-alanine transfer protein DltD
MKGFLSNKKVKFVTKELPKFYSHKHFKKLMSQERTVHRFTINDRQERVLTQAIKDYFFRINVSYRNSEEHKDAQAIVAIFPKILQDEYLLKEMVEQLHEF